MLGLTGHSGLCSAFVQGFMGFRHPEKSDLKSLCTVEPAGPGLHLFIGTLRVYSVIWAVVKIKVPFWIP